MSPSCTPSRRRSWRRRRRRAFSNSYNLLLCALPCPACTPGRKKEKNVTRELDSNCPPAPFSPLCFKFPFFFFHVRISFFFSSSLFFSWPVRRDSPTTWCEKFCHVQHQQKRMKGRVPQNIFKIYDWIMSMGSPRVTGRPFIDFIDIDWSDRQWYFLVPTSQIHILIFNCLN